MNTIKAIETQYKGYLFRSRLEARWAVFFDSLRIRWEYEKEGFDISGIRYLPDFYLLNSYIEIKPDGYDVDKDKKILAFSSANDNYFVFQGNPWPGEYLVFSRHGDDFLPIPNTAVVVCPLCETVLITPCWNSYQSETHPEYSIYCEKCDTGGRKHKDTRYAWFSKGTVTATKFVMFFRTQLASNTARKIRFDKPLIGGVL